MSSKRTDQPITKAHLEAFIKTQDDFALELYAYSLARNRGFVVTHAGSYIDPVTGKTRQFDVRAQRWYDNDFHVYFAIECKCLRPSFPLLISQIPRVPAESFQDIVRSPGMVGRGWQQSAEVSPTIGRFNGVYSLYPPNRYVGKALAQVGLNDNGTFVTNDYEVFDKWGQAIASANGLIREVSKMQATSGRSQGGIVIPVLVIPDGTLWVANYAENGTLQEGPTRADEAQFYIGASQTFSSATEQEYTITHLHVVTKTGLNELFERFIPGGLDISHLLEVVSQS